MSFISSFAFFYGYVDDIPRLFVYLRLQSDASAAQDKAVESLEQAGQPTITVPLCDAYDLGAEFFRWEIATAVAGALMSIDPTSATV